MFECWEELGHPNVETMLAEIGANDMQAAALARAVWESIPVSKQDQWREQLAAALVSYRSSCRKSRIGQIAVGRLMSLNGG